MAGLADLITLGKEYALFDLYLPFIILFALIYGLLNKSKIFGEGRQAKNLNLIISLASALFVLAYTPVGITMTQFFSNFFAGMSIIMVTALAFGMFVFLLLPAVGVHPGGDIGQKLAMPLVIIAALMAFGLYLSSGGSLIIPGIDLGTGGIGISSADMAIIILFGITGLAIWWLTKSEMSPEEKLKLKAMQKQLDSGG
jgi:hypothetical protein